MGVAGEAAVATIAAAAETLMVAHQRAAHVAVAATAVD